MADLVVVAVFDYYWMVFVLIDFDFVEYHLMVSVSGSDLLMAFGSESVQWIVEYCLLVALVDFGCLLVNCLSVTMLCIVLRSQMGVCIRLILLDPGGTLILH